MISTPFIERDAVVLGGGFFGLFSAKLLLEKGYSVTLLEKDPTLFSRASSINQARVHLGYHYPRSVGTAIYSAEFFNRFIEEFKHCISFKLDQIYAISSWNSYVSTSQFERFCKTINIPLEPISVDTYFEKASVDGAYLTKEYAFDAASLLATVGANVLDHAAFDLSISDYVTQVEKDNSSFYLQTSSGKKIKTSTVVNATYASVNAVLQKFGLEGVPLKYELSEIALGRVSPHLKNVGITVMDGPFFSMMPYGFTGFHSFWGVEYSPHQASHAALPTFSCQNVTNGCTPTNLKNCNACPNRPESSHRFMLQMGKKFLKPECTFEYEKSYFCMKAVLKSSELDDSRPTCLFVSQSTPKMVSVLSGKINTIYELERVL